jgi:serine/threonine-protein kinase
VIWTLLAGEARWPLHAAAASALAAAFAWLSRAEPTPRARLRALEFAVFGLMAGTIAVMQYQQMLAAADRGDAVALMAEVKNALIGSLILMFAYTMLIPNPRRTAAAAVLAIAAAPVVVDGLLFLRHPEALQFARETRVLMLSGVNTFLASIAASLAIFGTHVLNSLRREVFEARRLNQYQLGELLGAGGMGEVHRAQHRLLKRACAIKLIHPWSERDPVALERFEREVRATAQLSHPNVVEIYDYGYTDEGTFYYVMEYLDGLNLGDLVEHHGPLPPGRAIYLLTQVCEGLAEAHAAGLIHRDIKPTNLFAARVGRRCDVAKVLDFGLVKDTTPGSAGPVREYGVVGTLAFMAPEQRSDAARIDRRADLFGMGAVAYFLLTARLPFAGADGFRLMMTPTSGPLIPPSTRRPGVPADLERVVLRCLAKDPEDRYADAECVRDALAACASAGAWDARRAADWWRSVPSGSS